MLIRPAADNDFDAIWKIFHAVIKTGDTYVYEPDTTEENARQIWLSPSVKSYVAEIKGRVAGTYLLKPNQPGLGAHIANAGYMVDPEFRGHQIGKAMCAHSLEEAKKAGYRAMQFNIVVSTNTAAVTLWQKMGFKIIGTTPGAFRHQQLGYVDAHIMYQSLEGIGLAIPPREELAHLQRFVTFGNISDLHSALEERVQRQDAYIQFYQDIKQMADNFEIGRLESFLKKYLF